MQTVDFIKMSLEMSGGWILGLAKDMQDAPLTMPTAAGGNHPMWVVGHLAYSEANIVEVLIKGGENPLSQWEGIFKQGGEIYTDAAKYPPYEEVIAKLEEVRANTLALLDTLTDDDLDKPSHAEGDMKDFFGTIGACLGVVIIHYSFHGGQIADARRALGRPPLVA